MSKTEKFCLISRQLLSWFWLAFVVFFLYAPYPFEWPIMKSIQYHMAGDAYRQALEKIP